MTSSPVNEIVTAAQHLLSAEMEQTVLLAEPQLISERDRSLVIRCTARQAEHQPRPVLIKQAKGGSDLQRARTEWASLRYLSGLPAADGVAPQYLAGDPDQGLLVMEDLGEGCTLEDLLTRRQEGDVETALAAMGRQMARLHAATLDAETAVQGRLGDAADLLVTTRRQEAAHWLSGRQKLQQWFDHLSIEPPRDLDRCMQHVAAVYQDPGPMLAFSHGDPAPSNNHVRRGQFRLLDFEYGAFRHLLYDLTAWAVLCPLPDELLLLTLGQFQSEIGAKLLAIQNPTLFREGWAAMCVYRTLAIMTWIPCSVVEQNRSWVGDWTMREAVVAALSRMQHAAADVPSLQAACVCAEQLLGKLRRLWPEIKTDPTPPWPALHQ